MTVSGHGEEPALWCILGRCDSLRAEVYVRAALPAGLDAAGAMLSGTLAGPECRHAITLPVTAKLTAVRAAPGESAAATTLVARAILTEPSYWSPELPNLYQLEARLEAGGRERAAWRQPVGLRRLGIRGRSLWLDGRRYVPRGVEAVGDDTINLVAFRAAAVAAVVPDPSEALLARCDAEGVAVLALLADESGRPLDLQSATAAVRRWAWHPAVLTAVVPRGVSAEAACEIATAARSHRGTLLVAWEVDGSRPPPAAPAGIDLFVVALPAGGLPHDAWRTEPPALPFVARRLRDAASASPTEPPSRTACDSFQAALAGWGISPGHAPAFDWAGYVAG